MCWYSLSIHKIKFQETPWSSFGAWAWVWEVEGLSFDWLDGKGEVKGGKEDATILNGVFKGGVEAMA